VRIERAKRELVEGTRSIKDIARETGFGSSLRMYEVFLREVGLSPSDSREQRGMDLREPTIFGLRGFRD
jgi:AraC-like DNA-binding protein